MFIFSTIMTIYYCSPYIKYLYILITAAGLLNEAIENIHLYDDL